MGIDEGDLLRRTPDEKASRSCRQAKNKKKKKKSMLLGVSCRRSCTGLLSADWIEAKAYFILNKMFELKSIALQSQLRVRRA